MIPIARSGKVFRIHFDLEPFKCLVRQQYLYDFDNGWDEFASCKVFACSSYPGHLLTFHILVEDKFIYSYLPIQSLCWKMSNEPLMEYVNYFNCPSDEVTVSKFECLNKTIQMFNRNGSYRGKGKYLMTFDWHNDNQLCHLIEEDNGIFSLCPSHKIVVSDDINVQLPKFKKLHKEWKLK
jgi:hypothetical protein